MEISLNEKRYSDVRQLLKGGIIDMVKKIAPDHIIDFCDSFSNGDKIFEKIKNKYEGDFSFVYRVVCSCKNSLFWIYKDEHPTIVLECSKCKKRITAYDLKNYPLAIK